jgi:hypothetical protein
LAGVFAERLLVRGGLPIEVLSGVPVALRLTRFIARRNRGILFFGRARALAAQRPFERALAFPVGIERGLGKRG